MPKYRSRGKITIALANGRREKLREKGKTYSNKKGIEIKWRNLNLRVNGLPSSGCRRCLIKSEEQTKLEFEDRKAKLQK